MKAVTINGRRVQVPDTSSDEEIRHAGGIRDGRIFYKRDKYGNHVIPRGSKVNVSDGDVFGDSPRRIKG
jgi:hypothetical protein